MSRTTEEAPKSTRLSSTLRRRELVEHATRILNEQGLEALHVTALAQRAGVSRPLVYRVFPTREDLFKAVLEDFVRDMMERFQRGLVKVLPGTVATLTRAFIDASFDTIQAKGAASWSMLDPRSVSPDLARISSELLATELEPWLDKLATHLGVPKRRAQNQLTIIVAAGRAAVSGWLDGSCTREEAAFDATQAIAGLMTAFTGAEVPAGAPRSKRRPPESHYRRARTPRA